ncbi:MAG TPA: PAS domain S-box protein, partial [Thermoanaerobaculia bacterium]
MPNPSDAYAFSAFAIPTLLTAIVTIALGVLVLRLHPTRVSRAFLSMAAAVTVWMGAFTMLNVSRNPEVARFWVNVGYFGVPFIAPALYTFAVEVLRIQGRRRIAVWIGWIGAAMAALLVVSSDLIVSGVDRYSWGYYPLYAVPTSFFFLAFFFGYLIAAVVEFARAFPHAQGVERKRIRSVIVGMLVAYAACVDFLPKYGVDTYPFGYLPILGFLAIVAHTTRRYDLAAITPSFAAREIIGTMADPLFVCDPDGVVRLVNPAATNLLGYEASDVIGQPLDRFLDRRGDEGVFRSREGAAIDVTISSAPIIEDDDPVGTVIIARDVRERKRAERDVRHAVMLLRSTLDSTFDGILVTGEDGEVVSYNQRFLDMWGVTQEAVARGRESAMSSIDHQVADAEEFQRVVRSLYEQPDAESFDVIDFKDGRRFERYSVGRRIEGNAHVRVWSFRDVSARFSAEEALRESEVRYRLLFEQNAAGVCVLDRSGYIIDCNSTFAHLLGEQRATIKGRMLRDFYVRPIEHDELMAMLQDGGNLNSIEVEMRKTDGATRWLLQNLVRVGSGDSQIVHATVVDISDRKLAEEQIEFHAYHDVLTNLPNRKLFTDR